MPISITSLQSTNCRCDYSGLGYFVGGSKYGGFMAIPFKNTDKATVILKSITLPLGYWAENGSSRTVHGAVWLANRGPVSGAQLNVMDLYTAASSNLNVLRTRNNGNVSGNTGYSYWYSPWKGLGSSDRNKVLDAMYFSTNSHVPDEAVYYNTTSRTKEYTFYFNDIQIPANYVFYVGIYSNESECNGTSIAVRRLGYSAIDRNGSLDNKFAYDQGTMIACNYVSDYRGTWHFYHDYFVSSGHQNNYAHGVVDASLVIASSYPTPTINITSTPGTSKCDGTTTISYDSCNIASGTTYVQYSVNNKDWITVSGSSNSAGSFSYTPESFGIGYGNNGYSVRVRRVLNETNIDNISEISSITMKTYSKLTMSGFAVSPANVVNANTPTKLTWDPLSSNEVTTCRIEVIQNNSIISTIMQNIPSSTTSITITPSSSISITYDNVDVQLRITRTGQSSGYTASQSLNFKVLYTPTNIITNISPESLGIIKEDKIVTWSYPSGYKGIVSGYNVSLSNTVDSVEYNVTTNSVKINVLDLVPAVYYKIRIRPYYLDSGVYHYGSYKEINSYLYYDKGVSTPSILYPISSDWVGNTYRVVFQLPEDYNYNSLSQEEKANYRYHDVEVNINGKAYTILDYPSAFSISAGSLTHMCTVVFSPATIGIQSASANVIKVRAKSYFDTWSWYSANVVMNNIKSITRNVIPGEIIKSQYLVELSSVVNSICKAYGVSYSNDVSKGSIIYATCFNVMYNKLVEVKNKINNGYSFSNNNVKFNSFDNITVTADDVIYAADYNAIVSILSIFNS